MTIQEFDLLFTKSDGIEIPNGQRKKIRQLTANKKESVQEENLAILKYLGEVSEA